MPLNRLGGPLAVSGSLQSVVFAPVSDDTVYPPLVQAPVVLTDSSPTVFLCNTGTDPGSFLLPAASAAYEGLQFGFRLYVSVFGLNVTLLGSVPNDFVSASGAIVNSIVIPGGAPGPNLEIVYVQCENRTPVGGAPVYKWNLINLTY